MGANLQWVYLKGVNLKEVDLQEANLKDAYLKDAYLEKANLKKANLEAAFLGEAYGLSLEQLSKVKTFYDTKLDEKLLIPLREKYPVLFEETNG